MQCALKRFLPFALCYEAYHNTVWLLVGNRGMGYWGYYRGPLRDYHRDPKSITICGAHKPTVEV